VKLVERLGITCAVDPETAAKQTATAPITTKVDRNLNRMPRPPIE
jgi:hypothetical protein